MVSTYDTQMLVAPTMIFLYPLAFLPFLYVSSHIFKSEITATLTLVAYQILTQLTIPYLVLPTRMNAKTEVSGDGMFALLKMLFPGEATASSILYNSEVLKNLAIYRDQNPLGVGLDIEVDENHALNGRADQMWTFFHGVLFWVILMICIEWRWPCFCCYFPATRTKQVKQLDEDEFFGRNDEDYYVDEEGESSEMAQVVNEGNRLQLKFAAKNEPKIGLK